MILVTDDPWYDNLEDDPDEWGPDDLLFGDDNEDGEDEDE